VIDQLRHAADSTEIEISKLTDNGWDVSIGRNNDENCIYVVRAINGNMLVASASTSIPWALRRLNSAIIKRGMKRE